MKTFFGAAMPALIIALCWSSLAAADGSGDPAAVKEEDGKYFDKEGNPTYKVQADGTVDWYTYSGFRRYHSDCHVCHGPDGMGSSYAPALQRLPENAELRRFSCRRRRRPKEREQRPRKRHAGVRHQRECDVLP